jgi:hypothetical protein
MKRPLVILLVLALLFGTLLGLPLLIGVWLPDVFINREHTLSEQRIGSGHLFRVIQYWNHGDFYNTELVHTSPDGTVETHVLDPDDSKSWSVPLIIDEQHRTATVTLGGGRVKKVQW